MSTRRPIVNPSDYARENRIAPRNPPPLFDFDEDERERISRWLERMIVDLGFRMEELGPRVDAITLEKHRRGQMAYYKHAKKFCKWLLHKLKYRDKYDTEDQS